MMRLLLVLNQVFGTGNLVQGKLGVRNLKISTTN
jgi:hypothetical protein